MQAYESLLAVCYFSGAWWRSYGARLLASQTVGHAPQYFHLLSWFIRQNENGKSSYFLLNQVTLKTASLSFPVMVKVEFQSGNMA